MLFSVKSAFARIPSTKTGSHQGGGGFWLPNLPHTRRFLGKKVHGPQTCLEPAEL